MEGIVSKVRSSKLSFESDTTVGLRRVKERNENGSIVLLAAKNMQETNRKKRKKKRKRAELLPND